MTVSLTSLLAVAARAAVSRAAAPTTPPVGRLERRVGLGQIDVNLHLNYAAYLDLMELARWDWAIRTGQLRWWLQAGVRPIVGSVAIEYRRELKPFARFVVETRVVGFDRRAVVVEQCFVAADKVAADKVAARAELNLLLRRTRRSEGAEGGLLDRPELEATFGPLLVPPRG